MFGEVLPLARPYWRPIVEVLVLMVFSVGLGLVIPLSGKYLVDSVIAEGSRSNLVRLVVAVLVAYLLGAVIDLRRSYSLGVVNERIQMDLQLRVFTAMQRLPLAVHTRSRVGDLLARLSHDIDSVYSAITLLFGQGIFLLFSVIAAAITLVVLSPLLGAVLLVMVPLAIGSHLGLRNRLQEASFQYQERVGDGLASAQEQLAAQPVIKAYGLEAHAIGHYRQRLQDAFQAVVRVLLLGSMFQASLRFAMTFSEVLVLGVGGYLVLDGQMTVGTLLAAMALLPSLIQPVAALSGMGQTVHQATGAFARLREVLDADPEVADKPDAVVLPPFRREIRFDRVSFGYDEQQPIVHDLSLAIPAGSNVAIVGPSGAGKSTFVNLLLRFWDPQHGMVRVDGHGLRDLAIDSVRQQVGVVFQDTFLFSGSLRDNIALGKLDATNDDIVAAAQAAHLDRWIEGLPAGYDTEVGERGVRMSGGQRQRLALARALLRNPAILVLDEATSALDPVTEAGIQATLAEVARSRTTITITHRLTSVTNADQIFVIDQGRLVEAGTHADLMLANGTYRHLFDEQTRAGTPVAA